MTRGQILDLYNAIAHGDEAHRKWLLDAMLAWLHGGEIPKEQLRK